jgi:glycerophosphoryl diester phosphodiesterase
MLISVLWTCLILAAVFLFYLWTIHPSFRRRKLLASFTAWDYAHRGLWNLKEDGIPENSLPAFRRAVEHRMAIELDVHLTKDGKLIVFHDDDLERICGVSGSCEAMTAAELQQLSLSGTGEHMPLFEDVLSLVGGRVPLLIELKLPTGNTEICNEVYKLLQSYHGPYLIESFHPLALRRYRRLDDKVLLGQLSSRYSSSVQMSPVFKLLSTTLVENTVSRPDFIAYNFKHADVLGLVLNRKIFHTPVFAWTIRKSGDYRKYRKAYDAVIFERFLPEDAARP